MKAFFWLAAGLALVAGAIWAICKFVLPPGITYSGSQTGQPSGGASVVVPQSHTSSMTTTGGGSSSATPATTGSGNSLLSSLLNSGLINQGLGFLGSLFGGSGGGASTALSPTDTYYSGLGLGDTLPGLDIPTFGSDVSDLGPGYSLGSYDLSGDGSLAIPDFSNLG